MTEHLDIHKLANGMVLMGQPIEGIESASFHFLLPAGTAFYPADCCGAGAVLTDWLFRGAGDMDSRQLVGALDSLGIHRSASISPHHLSFSVSCQADCLLKAMSLYADVLLRPRLDGQQFELSRQLAVSDLLGLDDEPGHKVSILAAEQFFPEPYGRPSQGRLPDLQNLTREKCARIFTDFFNWSGAIFAVAGKYDFDVICAQGERLFSNAPASGFAWPAAQSAGNRYVHCPSESAQVHFALLTPTETISSPCYYEIMAVVSILSGGMSGRLFTEVREKRGLCYAVAARYTTLRQFAAIRCYAGTTTQKSRQTLEVILEQFKGLPGTITQDEVDRAKIGLKSSLIMQNESTLNRASGIAADFFFLNRVRPIDEIRGKIESLTLASIEDFLRKNPFEKFTLATIGPKEVRF